jgi:membrane protein YdbS with pleckstrin-like domain
VKIPRTKYFWLSDVFLFVYFVITVVELAAAKYVWQLKALFAAAAIGLVFELMRRLARYRYRCMLQQVRYDALEAALKESSLMAMYTCPVCEQEVADLNEHQRKAHGWSPSQN